MAEPDDSLVEEFREAVRARFRWRHASLLNDCEEGAHLYAPARPDGTSELFCVVCGDEVRAEDAPETIEGSEYTYATLDGQTFHSWRRNMFFDTDGREVCRRVLCNRFTEDQDRIAARTDGRCWYCGEVLSPANIHIEHQVPLSRGGRGKRGNRVAACRRCNLDKASRTLDEYRRDMEWQAYAPWYERQRQFLMYLGWLWLQAIGGSTVEYVPFRFYGERRECPPPDDAQGRADAA